MVFQVLYFPTFRAWSFVPALAVAFDVAVESGAIRFLASEVALSVVAKGFASNDPLYSTTGTLSKSKYLSFLRGAGSKVPYIAAALVAAGFILSDDGEIQKVASTSDDSLADVLADAGKVWKSGSSAYGSTISEALERYCGDSVYCSSFDYAENSTGQVVVTILRSSGSSYATLTFREVDCTYLNSTQQSLVSTCAVGYEAPDNSNHVATDSEIESEFFSYISSQPEHDQKFAFADSNGNLHSDLKDDIVVSSPPVMPDGSALPAVGDQLWVYADWIARGLAQTTDSTASYYVPSSSYDAASYLAKTVAASNQAITSSNANASSFDDSSSSDSSSDGLTKVEVTNIEQPLTLEQLESSYSGAANSLSNSVDEMTDWTDDYFNESENTLRKLLEDYVPSDWFTNIFDLAPSGSSQCVGWHADLQVFTPGHTYSQGVMFDAHCALYDEYIRPIVEYSLWMFTLIYVYRIGVKTLRSAA